MKIRKSTWKDKDIKEVLDPLHVHFCTHVSKMFLCSVTLLICTGAQERRQKAKTGGKLGTCIDANAVYY